MVPWVLYFLRVIYFSLGKSTPGLVFPSGLLFFLAKWFPGSCIPYGLLLATEEYTRRKGGGPLSPSPLWGARVFPPACWGPGPDL